MSRLTMFHGMIAASPEMRAFFERIERVARTNASVLVRGETGTGKELAARAIHNLSSRRNGPFRAINCATLTPELLASELFGHVRGAFTGAVSKRDGLFKLADCGTLFLDEIAELPLRIQNQLLRVLQERTFVPVGGTQPIQVDVRLVCATNRSLRREVAARRFREDLMYRVRVVPMYLPPLRDRSGDIEVLARRFVDEFNREGLRWVDEIDEDAKRRLLAHSWPGNIRELRNVIEYAFAIGSNGVLTSDELPPELRGEAPPDEHDVRPRTAEDMQRTAIMAALKASGGRRGRAAEALQMSRTTLWRKMREFELSS